MATRADLLEVVANGGSSGVELKRDDLRPHDLARGVVASLSLGGGMVAVGADCDGTIAGVRRDNIRKWVMNLSRDKIRPPIVPFYGVARGTEDDLDVAIVRETCGYGAHALRHNSANRYPIRVGTRSLAASQRGLARLLQHLRSDLRPVSGRTVADLDRGRLQNQFRDIRQRDVPAQEDGKARQTLPTSTSLMTEEGVTVGGMLLFGATPTRFPPRGGMATAGKSGHDSATAHS